ncbi:MAG: ABC transporter permease subunit, partial [Cyanobacteria bacterium KgW148]|nr:ABC transporter permease subunit [Cyanobacteria bacterium KgW148]
FRLEQSTSSDPPESWVYDLLTTARIPRLVGNFIAPLAERINQSLSRLSSVFPITRTERTNSNDRWFNFSLWIVSGVLVAWALQFIVTTVGFAEVSKVVGLGVLTLLRVSLLLLFATLIWTPVGVAIGFNPKLAKLLQPIVQFLASFPANFIFPFATLFFIRTGISIDFGSVLLMSLGAQWYILFNSIAGAQSIPTDLREMAEDIGLSGWKKWQRLIIPGIFSAWVTGGVTASGGAWNASIVSEIVSWGSVTLTAQGLGAYIAEATTAGDWARITLGIATMSLFVVGLNRIFWRRLYHLAETKYHL